MLLLTRGLGAQSAATVPSSSGIYDRLENLIAHYPGRGLLLGQRPMSRRELDRVLARLSEIVADSTSAFARREWVTREVEFLESMLGAHGTSRTVSGWQIRSAWDVETYASDLEPQRIADNGLGLIDAVDDPFSRNRRGWPGGVGGGAGTTLNGAPTMLLHWNQALALVVQPRLSLGSAGPWSGDATADWHRLYGRGVYRNVALQIGADELFWGQSATGALFISGNAAPFPAITLGTDTAVVMPWLLRWAGPARLTFVLADLGATQDPPHAKLAGWQASIQPWKRFELGVAVLAQTGGSGGPPGTFLHRFIDLFPIIDALAPQRADIQISNKLAGGNLRFVLPSGLSVYSELQWDDFDIRRLRSTFVDDAGFLIGGHLPLALEEGRMLALRAEWHRTSLRLYEHTQFRSGVTYRQRIIGSPLGPNAQGTYVSASWRRTPQTEFSLALANESRDPSRYSATSDDPRDRGFRFIRETDEPDYRRLRTVASVERILPAASVRLTLGHDRAWRSGAWSFGATGRSGWLARVAFSSQALRVW